MEVNITYGSGGGASPITRGVAPISFRAAVIGTLMAGAGGLETEWFKLNHLFVQINTYIIDK